MSFSLIIPCIFPQIRECYQGIMETGSQQTACTAICAIPRDSSLQPSETDTDPIELPGNRLIFGEEPFRDYVTVSVP